MAEADRISLFISYAHEDRKWLDELLQMLAPLRRSGIIKAWSDREIQAGDDWRKEIDDALARASVGLLLASAPFAASEFIMNKEVPYLLAAHRQGRVRILVIPVSPFLHGATELADFQWLGDLNRPLDALPKPRRAKELRRMCEVIQKFVTSPASRDDEREPGRPFDEPDPSSKGRGSPRRDTLIDRVADLAKLRESGAQVAVMSVDGVGIEYVRVAKNDEFLECYPIGVFPNGITPDAWQAYLENVVEPYRSADPGCVAQAVYGSGVLSEELKLAARKARIKVRSFVEFQGLLDFSDYMLAQSTKLKGDSLYPPELYVDQTAKWEAGFDKGETEAAVLQVLEWLAEPEGRFILVLGDFGTGKTFLMHQLALRLSESGGIVPALIEMRSLEKGGDLSSLAAQHFTRSRQREYTDEKFRRMLRDGRIVLLFDGFDELALRVTYDRATHHFDTLLSAMEGDARIIVTSRTQHFLTKVEIRNEVERVKKEIFKKAEAVSGFHLLELQGFKEKQIREFLVRYMKDEKKAQERLQLICDVKDLHGLAATPRMLSFIADIEAERLQKARDRDGVVTAASLYQEIIDRWFRYEIQRLDHPGGTPPLSIEARYEAVTAVALRLWAQIDRTMDLSDLTTDVQSALKSFDFLSSGSSVSLNEKEAVHQVGSGTLLVRDEDGKFSFVHQSIMEWLVAQYGAKCLADDEPTPIFEQREFSPLMVEFFCDLAKEQAEEWLKTPQASASSVASINALAIAKKRNIVVAKEPFRLNPGDSAQGQDFSGRDLRKAVLAGIDLTQARFVGADLREANLAGAVLAEADFTDARLGGASLKDATATGARFVGAELAGADFTGLDAPRASFVGAKLDSDSLGRTRRHFGAALPAALPFTRAFHSSSSPCRCVAFSPDRTLIASAHEDGMIRLLEAGSGRLLRSLEGHTKSVSSVAFSPDGERIASGSVDNKVRLWEAGSGRLLRSLEGHTDWVRSVAFSPDGEGIVSGSDDRTVRLWEAGSGRLLRSLEGHTNFVWSVAFSPDGERIASGSNDKTVRLWEAGSGRLLRSMEGHTNFVWSVAFSPDGERIASGSADKTVRLWEAGSGRLLRSMEGHTKSVWSVAFSPDGERIAGGGDDKTVRLWEAGSGRLMRSLGGHTNSVSSVAFNPDGKRLASGSSDTTVRMWEAGSGRLLRSMEGHTDWVRSVAFSPDGERIASGSSDKTVRLWEAGSGRLLQSLEGHANYVSSVAFSPDGERIASGSDDKTVRLWEADSGRLLRSLAGHTNSVLSVAFGPDGERIASGSADNTVRLWEAGSGRLLRSLKGHTNWVRSVAFSPDGKRLASASADNTIRIWDVATGRHLATLLPTPEGWAAFTAEGRYKCGGNVAGSFWYACNLVRFEPSELASLARYVPMFEPLPLDAPLY